MLPTPHPLASCLLLAAAFALVAPAAGADEPVVTPAPERSGGDAAGRPLLPDSPAIMIDPSDAPLAPFVVPAEPGVCRESVGTNPARAAGPALPTAHELRKLDLARAAIEASRAAGTLYSVPAPAAPAAPIPGSPKEKKRPTTPQALVPDAAAGIGDFPAVQEVGPAGPSEAELEKVRRHREEVRHD